MIRTTHVRSGAERWPHQARPRSGTFRTRRHPTERSKSSPSFPAPAFAEPLASSEGAETSTSHSERSLIACGIVGLVLFPIAGAAALGGLVSPLVFVVIAALAVTLFYRSLAKLESWGSAPTNGETPPTPKDRLRRLLSRFSSA
jgi:hypothetical protein